MRRTARGRLFGATGLASLAARAAADPLPMAYLHTFGAAGDPTTRLGWGLGAVSVAVIAIVAALLLAAVLRGHGRGGDARELAVRRDAGGMAWIYVGVGMSSVVLVVCAAWTMTTLAAVRMPAAAQRLGLRVSGAQWWWAVRYDSAEPAQVFATANEIHVPVGQPVRLELTSEDVIHSFWIPQLVGKTDLIPGQTNVMWLEADRVGVYRGQCAEYCGMQHAHMAMAVVAEPPEAYAAWRQAQLQPARAPVDAAARQGERIFQAHCAACHTVRGGDAGGILGPDLTHLMSRRTIAAGLLANTPGNLAAWVGNAQAFKPGTRMPSMQLSASELGAVVGYLETLH